MQISPLMCCRFFEWKYIAIYILKSLFAMKIIFDINSFKTFLLLVSQGIAKSSIFNRSFIETDYIKFSFFIEKKYHIDELELFFF